MKQTLYYKYFSVGGEGGIPTYAAVEKRSASLSQSATRFHLGKIWATIFSSALSDGAK